MPKYHKGDEMVEDPSGGLQEFYEQHGYVPVLGDDPGKPMPKGKKLDVMPSDLGKLADDLSKGEGD